MFLLQVTTRQNFLPMAKEPFHPTDWRGGLTATCDQSERHLISCHGLILAAGNFRSKVLQGPRQRHIIKLQNFVKQIKE